MKNVISCMHPIPPECFYFFFFSFFASIGMTQKSFLPDARYRISYCEKKSFCKHFATTFVFKCVPQTVSKYSCVLGSCCFTFYWMQFLLNGLWTDSRNLLLISKSNLKPKVSPAIRRRRRRVGKIKIYVMQFFTLKKN